MTHCWQSTRAGRGSGSGRESSTPRTPSRTPLSGTHTPRATTPRTPPPTATAPPPTPPSLRLWGSPAFTAPLLFHGTVAAAAEASPLSSHCGVVAHSLPATPARLNSSHGGGTPGDPAAGGGAAHESTLHHHQTAASDGLSRPSSDEGENEERDDNADKLDCHYSGYHPRPVAVSTHRHTLPMVTSPKF